MPTAKLVTMLTVAPSQTAEAIQEWMAGITVFLEWANLARTGETALPAAVQADRTLNEFSKGNFNVLAEDLLKFLSKEVDAGFSPDGVRAGWHILSLVRDSHWHLFLCRWCDRWVLVKHKGRIRSPVCRRELCQKKAKARQKAKERQDDLAQQRAWLAAARRR